jgi:hypothetical protein
VVTVIVSEVNTAPTLAPVADSTISEGAVLSFISQASDADLPPQELTYRLATGAPPGASVHPLTGEFTWRPTEFQGPSTNVIAIIVADNGAPNRSAMRTFTVIVRDVLGDFVTRIGSTHLLSGAHGSVPIHLISGADLTNVLFTLESAEGPLANLAVLPLVPELFSATLHAVAPGRSRVRLQAGAGAALQGARDVARLEFDAVSNNLSAIVPLKVKSLEGTRANATRLSHGLAHDGRVIVIGDEPVLEALLRPDHSRFLRLYGRPGHSYTLDSQTRLQPALPWTLVARVPLAETVQEITGLDTSELMIFYRAQEFMASPPVLAASRAPDGQFVLLLYGHPSESYLLQSSLDLMGPNSWRTEFRVQLTNSFGLITVPGSLTPRCFFRLLQE